MLTLILINYDNSMTDYIIFNDSLLIEN